MSTNSRIGIQRENGEIESIYCHWSGFPEWVGRVLQDHYASEKRVNELMALGNLSSLGPMIGKVHDFDDNSYDNIWCMAYGRDRGDTKNYQALKHTDFSDFVGYREQYTYLFKDGKWYMVVFDVKPKLVDIPNK